MQQAPEGIAFWLLAAFWILTLFDFQWFLAAHGIPVLLKAPLLIFLGLLVVLAVGVPNVKAWRDRWTWYPPFAAFMVTVLLSAPLGPHLARARDGILFYVLYGVLMLGTIPLISTARRAEQLLYAYVAMYLWFGIHAGSVGYVDWHPTLANYDGYGAFMAIGAGLCAFMAAAEPSKRIRPILMLTAGICVVGVVASFARGAFLAVAAVGVVVWFRSPHKGLGMVGAAVGAVVVAVASVVLFGDEYWREMNTILDGTSEATGEDRLLMWTAALRAWSQSPIIGVGIHNWGVVASELFQTGELGGRYAMPERLWGRSAHNSYFTILAEQGMVGLAAFAWIFVDFWKRNAAMKTREAAQRWREIGGKLDLTLVARGLEAGLVGWMVAAGLYSMDGKHWLYTLLALNLLLHSLVVARGAAGRPRRPRRRLRAAAAHPQGVPEPVDARL